MFGSLINPHALKYELGHFLSRLFDRLSSLIQQSDSFSWPLAALVVGLLLAAWLISWLKTSRP